ncbi:UDP-N-acetylglucosamine 4,6-dehydratase (inverting) [Candidatus Pelagibacter bacterium nBUS_44]|uniref:UDP-N-acetylglucosamine 4,6-dehydratase (inverting) n=1 Tax=Candidatus Pelagibacter bacterium nBUS_44 TaxID=3374195 RepID=UPI003EBCBC09
MNISGKSILLTGGTGSFGKSFVKYLISKYKNIKRLIIFSRDELKQYEMQKDFSDKKYKFLRYFIGDVRDYERLLLAMRDVDIVVHAAALKQVTTAEYNPFEVIKTNILGTQNIVQASLKTNINKAILLSTDKASSPANLYGASKLCADKLFISANNMAGKQNINFSVIRYGNVMGSRGSVIPSFLEQSNQNKFFVTHKNMTRFNITLKKSVELVEYVIKNAVGGEIFIPKIPSYKILDLTKAINPKAKIFYTGIREGEKVHEDLISINDNNHTYDAGKNYIICPFNKKLKNKIIKKFNARIVKKNFFYNSGTNTDFLNPKDLKLLIKNMDKV